MGGRKRNVQYPVIFSNGEWKYTAVVYVANSQIAMSEICAATAHICVCDHTFDARLLNDGFSWSARNRMDMVNRKICPEISCPFLNRGLTRHVSCTSGIASNVD